MSKPEEKRSPAGTDNPAASGESSDANTFYEIATMMALDEVGHTNTLIIEGLAPEEKARAKSIRNTWFDRLIQGMWRGEFTGLFLEYPPDGTEVDLNGRAWVITNDDDEEDDGIPTTEMDTQLIDRDSLWEMLKTNGLPQGVPQDAPDFEVLSRFSTTEYSEEVRLFPLKKIKVGRMDCFRWFEQQGIEPPDFIVGRQRIVKPKRHRGRWPSSHSQDDRLWTLFDERKDGFTFERGELTKVGKEIAKETGYKLGTVTDKIRSAYRTLEKKAPQK